MCHRFRCGSSEQEAGRARGMKLVVTGATGFIGRNLAEQFHAEGNEVTATGRSLVIGEELTGRGIDFQVADIRDQSLLSVICPPADCLVHCAARAGDWGRYQDFHEANVVGTRNVIETCRKRQIPKLVFISSPSVYFNGEDRLNISENEPLPDIQQTHYAKTKAINEKELLALRDTGINVIVLRPRAVFGPYDTTITPRILRMASDVPPIYRSSLRDSFLSYWIVEGGSYGPETVHGRSYRADVETGRG